MRSACFSWILDLGKACFEICWCFCQVVPFSSFVFSVLGIRSDKESNDGICHEESPAMDIDTIDGVGESFACEDQATYQQYAGERNGDRV